MTGPYAPPPVLPVSLLMSSARVYLNSHYVTDVLGGMLLGAAWTCLCQALVLAPARRTSATD